MRQLRETPAALIIPALNEEPVIGMTLRNLPAGLYQVVIVADNGSTDGTVRVASAHGATVVLEPRRGYGAACLRALAVLPSNIEIVVFMQADSSESGEEARLLMAPLQDGRADLTIGSRVLGNAAPGSLLPHQIFGNRLATFLVRLLYGYRFTDIGPYRAITREALASLAMSELDYGWTIEMQVKAVEKRLRIREIPVSYRLRQAGVNKVSGNLRASLHAGFTIIGTILRLWLRSRIASMRGSRSSSSHR